MSSLQVATFIAAVALGGAVGLLVSFTVPSLRRIVADGALPLAALVATSATIGSLYFSEVADYIPCEFCWYQRIAMYPLAPILIIAAIRGDRFIRPYVVVVAIAGLGLSIYHIQLQLFPEQSTSCSVEAPCTGRWVQAFGWMTIPQMAGVCFALIIGLMFISRYSHAEAVSDPDSEESVSDMDSEESVSDMDSAESGSDTDSAESTITG